MTKKCSTCPEISQDDNSNFCSNCGSRLSSIEMSSSSRNSSDDSSEDVGSSDSAAGNKRLRIGGISLVLFVLVVAIGFSGSSDNSTSDSNSANDSSVTAIDETPVPVVKVPLAKFQAAKARMNYRKDSVTGDGWYKPASAPQYIDQNAIFAYVGDFGSNVHSLRLKIQYSGEDWIFINKYTFNVDGEIYTITPEYSEVERDNANGVVWEYLDVLADPDHLDMLKAISTSKKAVYRVEGDQYRKDFTITSRQKQGIADAITVYDGLENGTE